MQKEIIMNPGFIVAGLTLRTNNANEMNPNKAKIKSLVDKYFSQNTGAKINHRKNPGVTIDGFINYATDEFGDYDYFIGEAVTEATPQEGFEIIHVPQSKYAKFTTPKGSIPEIIINAWQEIWKMKPDDLGGKRCYQVDFEVFDQRARDPKNSIIDIYIGIK